MKKLFLSAMALLASSIVGCAGDKCATVTCGGGQFCDAATGTCRAGSSCAGVTCATDQICDGATGTCKASDRCAASSCSASQICDGTNGMCVAKDLCSTVSCTNAQVCNRASGMCENPAVPALGVQIDRMGRPAVNTALTNPYDIYPAANAESGEVTKGRYNADADPTMWATNWTPAIRMNLAILDGLDGGTCGNQLAFTAAMPYTPLAGVLAADALQVDTTRTSCTAYLGVEVNALGIQANTECGGRTLSIDTIDATYGALIGGGTTSDNIAQSTAPSTTFPFFANPL